MTRPPDTTPHADIGTDEPHPRLFEPFSVVINIIAAALGALIGMQTITRLGITAYTSIIGAIAAMAVARIPGMLFRQFRSVHRQNLVETTMSTGTFAAGNSLMLPIAVPLALGHPELIVPMLVGAGLATFIDGTVLYRVFGSQVFPADAAWPAGVATAETIKAGDEGGRRAGLLGLGAVVGVVGAALGVSMSAFGVAFIGNVVALTAFGVGLLLAGYGQQWFGLHISAAHVPQGILLGAGLVALFQIIWMFSRRDTGTAAAGERRTAQESRSRVLKTGPAGLLAFMGAALILMLVSGSASHMSPAQLVGLIVFAGIAALMHQVLVGYSAMLAGWFPSVAVAVVMLLVGLLLGFPILPLGLAVGFLTATGSCFADMGYDLKTGWILRGNGTHPQFEAAGRWQQYLAYVLSYAVAIVVVALFHNQYFAGGFIPAPAKAFASTLNAGMSGNLLIDLVIWGTVGAALQLIGGPKRQIGILLATGMLVANGLAGWAVLAGIAIRVIIRKRYGPRSEENMHIFAAGCIAGDALYGFVHSMFGASQALSKASPPVTR